MSSRVTTVLPTSDRMLLRLMGFIVPAGDRQDWLRSWEAELWCRRYPSSGRVHDEWLTDLSVGVCLDALNLRFDRWLRTLRTTGLAASLTLGGAGVFVVFLKICLDGSWFGQLFP